MSTDTLLSPAEANALHHEDAHRGLTWMDVTKEVRKAFMDAAYEVAKEDLIKARTGKVKPENVWNASTHEQAMNIARGYVVQQMYKLAEHQGYKNPVHEDPVWGPEATKAEKQTENIKPNRYGGKCPKCDVWVEAEAGKLVKLPNGKWGAEHLTCPEVSQDVKPSSSSVKEGTDLTDLPSGYYAVPGGDTRLKVRIAHGKDGSKWQGFTFVTDGAEYGSQQRYGMQRPGQAYRGDIEDALKAILENPLEAQKAYGRLVGKCGRCGLPLEDETSVANGIGPICASKW